MGTGIALSMQLFEQLVNYVNVLRVHNTSGGGLIRIRMVKNKILAGYFVHSPE